MQIAMGSPLGAANCISLPQGAASQSPILERNVHIMVRLFIQMSGLLVAT